jgi:hypothetical protein
MRCAALSWASMRARARLRRPDGKPDLAHVTACGPRQAQFDGFDLQANVWVSPSDRIRFEPPCRDLLRPPLAQDRVTLRAGFRPTKRAEVLGINLIRVWEIERFASRGSFAVRLRGSSSGPVTRR